MRFAVPLFFIIWNLNIKVTVEADLFAARQLEIDNPARPAAVAFVLSECPALRLAELYQFVNQSGFLTVVSEAPIALVLFAQAARVFDFEREAESPSDRANAGATIQEQLRPARAHAAELFSSPA